MKYYVIGDIHGCFSELKELIHKLGFIKKDNMWIHNDNRKLVFLGDLTDRGPNSLGVINLIYELVIQHKVAHYVPGNHCNKLYRYLSGNPVKVNHGLETTVAELDELSKPEYKKVKNKFIKLYDDAPLYLYLKELNTIVCHAGFKPEFLNRTDKEVQTFVLYGETTGKQLPDGRPERRDWAKDYNGDILIVYGHTPVKRPRKKHRTINIDTGVVFGNKLTALSLPEEHTIQVDSSLPWVEDRFTDFES